ncbi:UNVERIFIED_CONTAM: TonB-dependent receptor plug domain-containing protein, partial [Prevotella sp. 15_C9]
VNMIAALAGKAAGVQINKNSSGMGGSAKVSLRGIRSVSGDNQPLYVIDGVPMRSGTINTMSSDAGLDIMSTINSSDIESVTVIKDA